MIAIEIRHNLTCSPLAAKLGLARKVPSPFPSRIEMGGLPPAFTTARSSRPSRFKSATATDVGLSPTVTSGAARKVPFPPPSKTDTEPGSESGLRFEFVMMRSARPSLFTSADAIPQRIRTNRIIPVSVEIHHCTQPDRMETLLSKKFVTARSIRPFSSKLPDTISVGTDPTVTCGAASKLPSPRPNTMETVLPPPFPGLVIARSNRPSRLKSAAVMCSGNSLNRHRRRGPKNDHGLCQ